MGASMTFRRQVIYVASRASIPERAAQWRTMRDSWGYNINSSWIDEAGQGETKDFADLWDRVEREITAADKFVLYAEPGDFPLKGALVEVGIALGVKTPVVVCLPNVVLEHRSMRPLGSWINHRRIVRCDDLIQAIAYPLPDTPWIPS
jgi:hypothetical protein